MLVRERLHSLDKSETVFESALRDGNGCLALHQGTAKPGVWRKIKYGGGDLAVLPAVVKTPALTFESSDYHVKKRCSLSRAGAADRDSHRGDEGFG